LSAGPRIGILPHGSRATIADVAGVTVGHCTLASGDVQTGVTVVRPHGGDPFRAKVPAAAVVINGFGKSVGLLQVNELGVLETPIALTNTFSVGTVATAQIRAAVAANPGIARTTTIPTCGVTTTLVPGVSPTILVSVSCSSCQKFASLSVLTCVPTMFVALLLPAPFCT